MKQLVTILLTIWSITAIKAQTPERTIQSAGISTNASILDYSVRGYLEPYVAWGFAKKQLIIAPTILASSNLGYQSPQSLRITGTRIGYCFWPGTLDKKWEFHVSADMRLQRLKDLWDANFYSEQLSDYHEYHMKTIELLMENYVGYGLVFNITQSLSISQGVALGWYLSNLDVRAPNANTHLVDTIDYRGYGNVGFLWNVRFEVRYKLFNNYEL